MRPRAIEDCLKADAGIARLSAHAARLLRLHRLFEAALPPSLSNAARVANLRLGKVIVHADNGAVAAKLRQITPRLGIVFTKEFAEVTGIEVKVQARGPVPRGGRTVRPAPIGASGKRALTSAADSMPEGSPIRAALRRLIERS